MGVVYLAQDERLDRRAALKFLSRQTVGDEVARARFLREGRAGAALDHPNICTVFAVDETSEGEVFIAMAYYDGQTLKERLERGSVPLAEALAIVRQAAAGLDAAHRRGIIHRDVKPANLMISDGVVKLLDFGIARFSGQTSLTRTGAILGTPRYSPPERQHGRAGDHRADVWSLGAVLRELAEPHPLTADVDEILRVAMADSVGDRYQSMREFIAAIDAATGPMTVSGNKSAAPNRDADDSWRVELARGTESGFQAAVRMIETHVATQAQDASLRAGLAEALLGWIQCGADPAIEPLATRSRGEAVLALELDSTKADVQLASGRIAYRLEGNLELAERRLRRATARMPGSAEAHQALGECLALADQRNSSLQLLLPLVTGRDLNAWRMAGVGRVLHLLGDYPASATALRRSLDAREDAAVRLDLALTLAKIDAAAALEFETALSFPEGAALVAAAIGNRARTMGRRAATSATLDYLNRSHASGIVTGRCLRLFSTRFGETDQPLEYFEGEPVELLRHYQRYLHLEGSLSSLIDCVGLIAYWGWDVGFECLTEVPGYRDLYRSLVNQEP